MSATISSDQPGFPFRFRDVVLGVLLGTLAVVLIGVTSYFRLTTETALLRESAMGGVKGTWHKRIALNVGELTTGLVRAGSRLLKLAPEPRAALASIRSAEVGVYDLQDAGAGWVDRGTILARADKAMSARRWDRVVGVSRDNELVAVYLPRRGLATDHLKCCVLVLQGQRLVVVGATGNLEPVLELASYRFELSQLGQHLALR